MTGYCIGAAFYGILEKSLFLKGTRSRESMFQRKSEERGSGFLGKLHPYASWCPLITQLDRINKPLIVYYSDYSHNTLLS